ncbi:MAG: DUF2806 domain-containing protein [Candidatus Absconditabacteria bacterium]
MDSNIIPSTVTKVVSDVSSKPLASFGELISLWLFGKSIGKCQAQKQIATEKELAKWEAEKPWFQKAQEQKFIREYSNLGSVLVQAQPLLNSDSNKIENDNDLFYGLLEHAKNISNSEMQQLIAKIIAGEYNNPGSYSMSTLHSIKMLGKEELELFERISSLVINYDSIPKIIFTLPENAKDFMGELKIDFGSLQILQNLGLFLPNDMTSSLANPLKQIFALQYFEKKILFKPTHENNFSVKMPEFYALSITGKQIIKHLNPKYNERYFSWLKENYIIPNFKVIEENKTHE